MKRTGFLVFGLLLLFAPLRRSEPFPLDQVLEHGHPHESGVAHADPDDAHHEHGDADDHHEAPGTPCHHHDTHSCFGHASVHLLAMEGASLNSVCWQRFVAADLITASGILTKKQFHVPLA